MTSPNLRFVVCIKSGDYVDLEPLKVYEVRRDAQARATGMLRVVDASGDDYLYPVEYFQPIQAPRQLFNMIEKKSSRRSTRR
jgi:hypothetical protein